MCLQPAFAQQFNDAEVLGNTKKHIYFLADDKLEGRLVGSKGEKIASDYIIEAFKKAQLQPKGENNNWLQPFTLKRLTYVQEKTFMEGKISKGRTVNVPVSETEFYPLAFSGTGKVKAATVDVGYGIEAKEEGYDDYAKVKDDLKGKIFLITWGHPEKDNPHSKLARFADAEQKVETAIKKGASAVLFLVEDTAATIPAYQPFFKEELKSIPVVIFTVPAIGPPNYNELTISVDTISKSITGHNVIGMIDNKAEYTVIIGAHYDHLGYNELGGSTYRPEGQQKAQIHNGADDNASGTAALIELARLIKQSAYKNYNYVFMAFSGEEEGLLGSNYFTRNPTLDTAKFNYMINMDMLGRLDTVKNSFVISGTGTSPSWDKVLPQIPSEFKVKYDASGTGSSDHTSFYYLNKPVLHFFTGTHHDYHKPSDDAHTINYEGEVKVIRYIYDLVGKMDQEPKLVFTPTKQDTSTRVAFKVTLGIMPDYLFEGKGVKVDGVTAGRPAAVGGIKRDDVLLKLGEIEIVDMKTYMKALASFKKGETVKLKYVRDGKETETEVTF